MTEFDIKLPCAPFIHCFEMLFVAINDEVRSFNSVLKIGISKNTGKLKDSVFHGIKARHFQIDPEKLRCKTEIHHKEINVESS
jgi:hypothetical protein